MSWPSGSRRCTDGSVTISPRARLSTAKCLELPTKERPRNYSMQLCPVREPILCGPLTARVMLEENSMAQRCVQLTLLLLATLNGYGVMAQDAMKNSDT